MSKGWVLLSITLLFFVGNAVPCEFQISEQIMNNETIDSKTFNWHPSIEKDSIMLGNGLVMTHCEYLQMYQLSNKERREFIAKYGVTECADTQDALNVADCRWENNIVPFVIDSVFNKAEINIINSALKKWHDSTCLIFEKRNSESDYIYFRGNPGGCSSQIGQIGGEQTINLDRSSCVKYGIVLQHIGHALGLYPEHSRPDRDEYITVNYQNILPNHVKDFDKLQEDLCDFQASEYDYSSIMQYSSDAFSSGGNTIDISNEDAYEMQGKPKLGHGKCLTPHDKLQVSRMYHCPIREGYSGVLMVKIHQGMNLNSPQASFIKVLALDSNGQDTTLQSSFKFGSNPVWEETLFFPYADWQLFRISVWNKIFDGQNFVDERKSMSRTYPIYEKPEKLSQGRKYCANVACNRYVRFDYDLIPVREGGLKVTIEKAEGVPSDGGIPSPYVRVIGMNEDEKVIVTRTTTKQSTTDPIWNEVLDIYQCTSLGFFIEVWSKNGGSDTKVSQREFVELTSPSDTSKKVCFGDTCNFFVSLSYEMIPSSPYCAQIMKGHLKVYVKYGKHLSSSFSPRIIDATVGINAYTHDGQHVNKKTRVVSWKYPPIWNEEVDFGENNWKEFKVTILDKWGKYSYSKLSRERTWVLPLTRGLQSTSTRIYGFDGYVDFDYQFM